MTEPLTLEALRAELAPLKAELASLRAELAAIRMLPIRKQRPPAPNAETIAAMEAAERGEFTFSGTLDDFKVHLRAITSAGSDDVSVRSIDTHDANG